MRPAIDIEQHRDEIEQRIRDKTWNTTQAIAWLRANGTEIKPTAFKKRLKQWGVEIKPRRQIDDSEVQLKQKVEELFWTRDIGDDESCKILNTEGHTISVWQYKRLRRSLGLKRSISKEEQADHNAVITQVLTDELAGTTVDDYGYRNLARALRTRHHLIGRDRIYSIARRMHPAGPAARTVGGRDRVGSSLPRAREPDHIWPLDGYCELEYMPH